MTRKHFVAVAKMISELKNAKQREYLTQWFSVFFMKYNPRFDMRKFCFACLPVEHTEEDCECKDCNTCYHCDRDLNSKKDNDCIHCI